MTEEQPPRELEKAPSTTLVEVTPGVAAVFGDVPDGMEIVAPDLIPSLDREALSIALGTAGNLGTIVGNVAEASARIQGFYRLADQSRALLNSGGALAVKDGANLGTILVEGGGLAQARFVPVTMTGATALAAIGPAIAMLALQMQLAEISALARTNIALTTSTLKALRNEQWSELEGIADAVGMAVHEARDLGGVNDSVWEPVAPSRATILKQLGLYSKNVADHVGELESLEGRPRREYLGTHAEAIVFDIHALVRAAETYAQYQGLRASLARTRSATQESEAALFDRITRTTGPELETRLEEIRRLALALVRELRIISELPGRATAPLTRRRRDDNASRLTCAQLLEAITPLADAFHPATPAPGTPDVVCGPDGVDLKPYLRILRWHLDDGEQLRGVAFPYTPGAFDQSVPGQSLLARRADTAWDTLVHDRTSPLKEAFAQSTFVAVTDRRVVTADPRTLLNQGRIDETYGLEEVRYVRSHDKSDFQDRPTVGVITDRRDLQWVFPADASVDSIASVTSLISNGAVVGTEAPAALDSEASTDELPRGADNA